MIKLKKLDLIEFAISLPQARMIRIDEPGELKTVKFNKALQEIVNDLKNKYDELIVEDIASSYDSEESETGRIVKVSYINSIGNEKIINYLCYFR